MRSHLDRIRDLTDEVQRQLGPLSKQAETASKAQRIQHDVRDASARLLADEVVSHTHELKELIDSDQDLEQRQRELTAELKHAEESAQQLSGQHAKISQASARARDHRYQLTALAERYRSLQALANERYRTASRPPVASSGLSPEEAEKQLIESKQGFQEAEDRLQVLSELSSEAQDRREKAERQARIARETHTQLVREEADQQKTLAVVESRKNSAETKFAALSAELERLLADGSQRSTSTLESEQEIEVQEQALHEAQAAVGDAAHEKAEAEEVSNSRRSVVKDAEETLNNIKSELSAAQARIKVLEQSLQPASGTALAALHEHDPHDVSDILNIEPGWETAIAALLAASTDRAWLNSLETSIAAVETLQQHDVADIRIFYPS